MLAVLLKLPRRKVDLVELDSSADLELDRAALFDVPGRDVPELGAQCLPNDRDVRAHLFGAPDTSFHAPQSP